VRWSAPEAPATGAATYRLPRTATSSLTAVSEDFCSKTFSSLFAGHQPSLSQAALEIRVLVFASCPFRNKKLSNDQTFYRNFRSVLCFFCVFLVSYRKKLECLLHTAKESRARSRSSCQSGPPRPSLAGSKVRSARTILRRKCVTSTEVVVVFRVEGRIAGLDQTL